MKSAKKILIFRIGQLGDMLVSVPALWAIRNNYPEAHLTLLYDGHIDRDYVKASDVLEGSGIVNDFFPYHIVDSKLERYARFARMLSLMWHLRSVHYDMMIYLVPSIRNKHQIRRDTLFFRLAGIRKFVGIKSFRHLPKKIPGQFMSVVPKEADLLLERLQKSGIPPPRSKYGRVDVNIGEQERIAVSQWLEKLPQNGGRQWLALGPGSKMPAKIWPMERYIKVISHLIEKYDIWPVVFGGPEDRALAESMVSMWERGYVAAGFLNTRQAIAAMEKCAFYLGNDMGTMHMAVAAGLKCVAIFSSRDYPGNWEPYTEGHIVLRTPISCEGCMLVDCKDNKMKCILAITVENVLNACKCFLTEPKPSLKI
ncbi:MAG: glycosyltransferase family 9 protein [Planctomycetes bacterium]|nr:glycosyltransferase family 9 protein [Planctomycetota bacterium]